jgi:hypothetical protein
MPDERTAADQVAAFWDALVLGVPTDEFAVDDELAAALRRFQEIGAATPTTARERVWERLQSSLATPLQAGKARPRLGQRRRIDGPIVGSTAADQPRRGRPSSNWVLAQFATAFLLLVTLALGLSTLGVGRLGSDRPTGPPVRIEGPDAEALVPGIATPSAGPAVATLFATTLSTDDLPSGQLRVVLWRLSLAPGDGFPPWTRSQSCCRGPQFTHVLEGELTVRATESIEVVRGGDGSATLLRPVPGEEIVVGPGDTIVHDFAFPAAYTVRGEHPVQIVNAGLFSGTMPSPWLRHSGYLGGGTEALDGPLPPGPVSVSLIRAELPPGGETRPPPFGSLVLATSDADNANVVTRPDGSLFNLGGAPETSYAVVLEPTGKPSLLP